jgi:hypothetical protein
MKKAYLVAVVVGAFLVGYFLGCGDELNGGQEGGGGGDMAMVLVYGSGRNKSNQWRMLNEVTLSDGEVKINTREYESYYYRVVVIY